ncbi:hypothetical protein BDN72DRAFT_264633 [Pluteus cervinus]|uniref:Uncharacterized protein n=1 Tax=Pluteus cervinus TaxID=181527 RepID=A0ACD3AHU7_9AGAR|nr:hypothetical protein BDN72DRAFT_264633 [Pluteus cervinus]
MASTGSSIDIDHSPVFQILNSTSDKQASSTPNPNSSESNPRNIPASPKSNPLTPPRPKLGERATHQIQNRPLESPVPSSLLETDSLGDSAQNTAFAQGLAQELAKVPQSPPLKNFPHAGGRHSGGVWTPHVVLSPQQEPDSIEDQPARRSTQLTSQPKQFSSSAEGCSICGTNKTPSKADFNKNRVKPVIIIGADKKPPKKLILCFDGTGNKFGQENSNVVRFFTALKKDDPDKQLCYYQPGVGTYTTVKFNTVFFNYLYRLKEEALASDLEDHVKEGYSFIMKNYYPGDEIFLFGFSRGAYTARALSGMIYKVGLLPRHNDRQIDFAFTVYNTYDKSGARTARKFKKAFALDVPVRFVGVWDTVSSVGIIPTTLPFSTYNDGVKAFRHAIALDERRARFRPCLWGEPQPTREVLDNDPKIHRREKASRDEWDFKPMDITDVKEVWFVGCHADVGGGSHPDEDDDDSLSYIALRWMIMECFRSKTGIEYEEDELLALGFKKEALEPDYVWNKWESSGTYEPVGSPAEGDARATEILASFADSQRQPETHHVGSVVNDPKLKAKDSQLQPWMKKENTDLAARIYDQMTLSSGRFWWLIEWIPTMILFRTDLGWLITRERNQGRGRYLPDFGDEKILVHVSVLQRMEKERLEKKQNRKDWIGSGENGKPYAPRARNWENVYEKDDRIIWVY